MIKSFIQSIVADYQRLILTKFLLGFCVAGGFMVAVLILAILLMLTYPAYMWCVFGGFIIIWLLAMLMLYVYARVARADYQARLSQLDSIEKCVKLGLSVADYFFKSKK